MRKLTCSILDCSPDVAAISKKAHLWIDNASGTTLFVLNRCVGFKRKWTTTDGTGGW